MSDDDVDAPVQPISYAQFQLELVAARAEYKRKEAELVQRLRMFQAGCNHAASTYHPDPSGNNDSYTICDLCNKEL